MHCPRCEGTLMTFAVEVTGASAVICESCGFAGVPASHRSENGEIESWEKAIERFDETVLPPERTCRTERDDAVQAPIGDSSRTLDSARLDESVSVAASLRDRERDDDEEEETN